MAPPFYEMIPPGAAFVDLRGCLTCSGFRSSRFGLFAARGASFTCELDASGIMNETVQDGVGVSWVSDDVVPGCHGLGGDDRRWTPIGFFEDFQEIVAGANIAQRRMKRRY
jgi:hypothetical protein